jgi:hypothetical protein
MFPKIEDFMESWSASPSYISEKGMTLGKTRGGLWAKHMGLK